MRYDATETSIHHRLLSYLKQSEDKSSAFFSELFVGGFSRRADLVVANGSLSAYEIKSASDNISRLEGQLSVFQEYFEGVTVVTAEKHLSGVLEKTPGFIGIWLIKQDGEIEKIRLASKRRVKKSSWLSHLPVDVLKGLLRLHGHSALGDRYILETRCLRNISVRDVRDYVLEYFKNSREKRILRLQNQRSGHKPDDRSREGLWVGQTQSERDAAVLEFAKTLRPNQLIPIPRKTVSKKDQKIHPQTLD